MFYPKPKNYARCSLLVGCLFSVRILVLDNPEVAHAEDSAYVYKLDHDKYDSQNVSPVDPLNPTVEVTPLPPGYTPREKDVKKPEEEENDQKKVEDNYSTPLPDGKTAILVEKGDKKFKKVNPKNEFLQKDIYTLAPQSDGSSSGNDNSEMAYLEELYMALSGSMLYGDPIFDEYEE
ncbi:hypothetical protein ACWOFR_04650 [Carnobacterium gallinarum]|uniref:hypothetical protein n=1 Tax=Carnobacterium gallinarum TaxID=2749 RepID=UPI000559053C|nr:hypothetical protein [Carnobacterium gallinarum]